MMDDFETSLQVLRGFETDISAEVNDIKVSTCYNIEHTDICTTIPHASGSNSIIFMQRAVASANKRTTIRFQELNQKKYRTPLIVISLTL
jgi:SP family sugar porter-like MFS transporter